MSSQGFEAREAAVDAIAAHCAAAGCSGISYTVVDPSMFFKDADRMFASMARRGTASALGDGFNRRFNPIHGADLAARCFLHRTLRGCESTLCCTCTEVPISPDARIPQSSRLRLHASLWGRGFMMMPEGDDVPFECTEWWTALAAKESEIGA